MRGGLAAAFGLAAALLGSPVLAQERLLTLRASNATSWDDNVFRMPGDVADPQIARGVSGRSDRLNTTTVGLNAAKAYSQQRFLLDFARSATRYGKFTFLDRESTSYRGEWQWHLTPRVSGTLSADRNESPVPFDETRDLEANELIGENRRLSFTVSPSGRWQLLGGVQQGERRYSRPFASQPDTRDTGLEAGLRYVASSGTALSLVRRSQRGSASGQAGMTGAVIGDFTNDETELQGTWLASGKSTLTGRLARIERRHRDVPERDFSGMAGELRHAWAPTGRLSLNLSAQRGVSPFILDTRASYRVDETIAVAPVWQLTSKIRLSMTASRQSTDYRGPIAPLTEPARRDVLHSAMVAADWTPHRAVVLTFSLRRDRRSSTEGEFAYKGTTAGISAAFTL